MVRARRMALEAAARRLERPLAYLGGLRLLPIGTLLSCRLGAIGSLDEEQVVRRVVVGLPVPVLHHQRLDATHPAGELLAALDAGLRPQPGRLQHRLIAGIAAHRASPSSWINSAFRPPAHLPPAAALP